jgi:hypothetical protein
MSNHPRHWTARRSKRRVAPYWEVRNTRGVMAVVYGKQDDAELMAAAPRLLTELKHQIAIVQPREGDLRASERALLERARALVSELH